jgi:hypothetical protein
VPIISSYSTNQPLCLSSHHTALDNPFSRITFHACLIFEALIGVACCVLFIFRFFIKAAYRHVMAGVQYWYAYHVLRNHGRMLIRKIQFPSPLQYLYMQYFAIVGNRILQIPPSPSPNCGGAKNHSFHFVKCGTFCMKAIYHTEQATCMRTAATGRLWRWSCLSLPWIVRSLLFPVFNGTGGCTHYSSQKKFTISPHTNSLFKELQTSVLLKEKDVLADVGFLSTLYQECLFHSLNAVCKVTCLCRLGRPTEAQAFEGG